MYDDVDDIDLFVGATLEENLKDDNTLLGPVFTCILVFRINNTGWVRCCAQQEVWGSNELHYILSCRSLTINVN